MFINVLNTSKLTFFTISTGLFIKFYEKKKSLKKTKTIKFLIIKFLRKILIILKLNNLILKIFKKPIFFLELLNLINQPISHKFLNPCDGKFIDETFLKKNTFKFIFLIFSKNLTYCKNKLKKKEESKEKL